MAAKTRLVADKPSCRGIVLRGGWSTQVSIHSRKKGSLKTKLTTEWEKKGPDPSPNAIKDSLTFKSPPGATSNASEHAPGCCEAAEKPTHPSIPSNKAHPTLSDGRQSPNVDVRGKRVRDIPEDVQRHNAEIKERHGQSYNRISDRGDVIQGFRSGST